MDYLQKRKMIKKDVMNNILIYSDLHINLFSLKECILILEEIGMLINKHNIDTIINLGDTFDRLKPSSFELDIFATFIRRLGNNKQHIILAADSHESTTHTESILNHYGILSDNITVMKNYKDEKKLFCGHFIVKEAKKNFGTTISKKDLHYAQVFLGHQHSWEIIKPNVCQLGSCRWVNFDEVEDKSKVVAIITDYGTNEQKTGFQALKSPIPMIEIYIRKNEHNLITDNKLHKNKKNNKNVPLSEVSLTKNSGSIKRSRGIFKGNLTQCESILNNLDPHTKVKVKILDFESYKEFLLIEEKYKNKFIKFVRENEFKFISTNTQKCTSTETDTLKKSFEQFSKNNEIDIEIKHIINEELQ